MLLIIFSRCSRTPSSSSPTGFDLCSGGRLLWQVLNTDSNQRTACILCMQMIVPFIWKVFGEGCTYTHTFSALPLMTGWCNMFPADGRIIGQCYLFNRGRLLTSTSPFPSLCDIINVTASICLLLSPSLLLFRFFSVSSPLVCCKRPVTLYQHIDFAPVIRLLVTTGFLSRHVLTFLLVSVSLSVWLCSIYYAHPLSLLFGNLSFVFLHCFFAALSNLN